MLSEWQDGGNAPPYIELSDFTIYRQFDCRMTCLNHLKIKPREHDLMFDGVISVGSHRRYLEGVPFEIVSIDGYETDVDSVNETIYIQTPFAMRQSTWYRLGTPSAEYLPYHRDFLWVANFAKYFTGYLLEHDEVDLEHFRRRFVHWARANYETSQNFKDWYSKYGKEDFRHAVAAYPEYLWRESVNEGVDPDQGNRDHPIWKEAHPDRNILGALKFHRYPEDSKTIVTPYTLRCFEHFYFSDQLEAKIPLHSDHESYKLKWKNRLNWRTVTKNPISRAFGLPATNHIRDASVGDIVGILRDTTGTWRDKNDIWFAYVHATELDVHNKKMLHVLWLYRPEDTIMSTMYYEHKNELFMSDHCNCKCSRAARIYPDQVVAFPKVALFSDPIPVEEGYFVRSTYMTDNVANKFVTLEGSHLYCEDHYASETASKPHYPTKAHEVNSTVLVRMEDSKNLEPVEIIAFIDESKIQVRRFFRRERDFGIPSLRNELVLSESFCMIPRRHIVRNCHLRVFTRTQVTQGTVPAPYSYQGTGDCFVVSSTLACGAVTDIEPAASFSFIQGFNPSNTSEDFKPLTTLDLFCGGGNFFRGFEDAGVAHATSACDINAHAIHTKKANQRDPSDCAGLYWGSAVEYFRAAIRGKYSRSIAVIGSIQLILAGSPCQGFSGLQQDKTSPRSRRNASMVALVVAFVELYRPEYALLENVFGMTVPLGEKKDQQVFAQIICALVGMGYQTQCFQIDAVTCGSSQTRTRIIISIAAPGLKPLEPPAATHAYPYAIPRKIGRTVNGVPFGANESGRAPFDFVGAKAATCDLPDVGNSATGICIPWPDHRVCVSVTEMQRLMIPMIPRFPPGLGLAQAVISSHVPEDIIFATFGSKRDLSFWANPSLNKAFKRVHPDLPFDTVITVCAVADKRIGKWLHWDEHRPITVAEARRAQSIPDSEVLIGSAAQQWKIVGNGVDRCVAASLGICLREAWIASCHHLRNHVSKTVSNSIVHSAVEGIWQGSPDRNASVLPLQSTVQICQLPRVVLPSVPLNWRNSAVTLPELEEQAKQNPDSNFQTRYSSQSTRNDLRRRTVATEQPLIREQSPRESSSGASSETDVIVLSDPVTPQSPTTTAGRSTPPTIPRPIIEDRSGPVKSGHVDLSVFMYQPTSSDQDSDGSVHDHYRQARQRSMSQQLDSDSTQETASVMTVMDEEQHAVQLQGTGRLEQLGNAIKHAFGRLPVL